MIDKRNPSRASADDTPVEVLAEAAVLAAGFGTRLSEASSLPKPLASVGGKALIDRQLDALRAAGVSRVGVVVREEHQVVLEHLAVRQGPPVLDVIAAATGGGKASLLELRHRLAPTFVLLTVDSIVPPDVLPDLISAFGSRPDLSMGVTVARRRASRGDVGVLFDRDGVVREIGKHLTGTAWIAEGPAVCSRAVFDDRLLSLAAGDHSLSNYKRLLVEHGHEVWAFPIPWVVDVDDVSDLMAAEAKLHEVDT